MSDTSIVRTICAVCKGRVRVASGHIVKHRIDGHVCDNSGCSVEANERGRADALAADEIKALRDLLTETVQMMESIEDQFPGRWWEVLGRAKDHLAGSHTRTSTTHPDAGPDYCAECSDAAQDWVEWPCSGAGNGGSAEEP